MLVAALPALSYFPTPPPEEWPLLWMMRLRFLVIFPWTN